MDSSKTGRTGPLGSRRLQPPQTSWQSRKPNSVACAHVLTSSSCSGLRSCPLSPHEPPLLPATQWKADGSSSSHQSTPCRRQEVSHHTCPAGHPRHRALLCDAKCQLHNSL